MVVRNKSNGKEYAISLEEWDKLKTINLDRLFTVVDISQLKESIAMPIEIMDIMRAKEIIVASVEPPTKPVTEKASKPTTKTTTNKKSDERV